MQQTKEMLEVENEELRRENDYLRRRNVELQLRIRELEAAAAEASNIRSSGSGSKRGRKVRDEKWQERYREVAESIKRGEGPAKARERLGIGKSTYYRFRTLYLEELTGGNKDRTNVER